MAKREQIRKMIHDNDSEFLHRLTIAAMGSLMVGQNTDTLTDDEVDHIAYHATSAAAYTLREFNCVNGKEVSQ